MVRISRIIRDYSDAGGLNTLLAPWGFLGDATLLTKAGHVAIAYSLRAADVDGLTHAERQSAVRRMEAGLRVLDERCHVYQYLIKRIVDPFVAPRCPEPVAQEAASRRAAYLNGRREELCRLEQFLILLYEPPGGPRVSTRLTNFWRDPRGSVRAWLGAPEALRVIEADLAAAGDALQHKAEMFEAQLLELGPKRLSRAETFRLLRRLVNYDASAIDATLSNPPAVHLDYFVADSAVECHRDHLNVGRRAVKVLTMKEPPSQTFAHVLADLFDIPGEFVACLDWQRVAPDKMRRDINSRRRHFFNKRVSLVNYVTPGEPQADDMLVDESATATVRQLGDALTEIEVNGHSFGQCSLTLVLHAASAKSALRN